MFSISLIDNCVREILKRRAFYDFYLSKTRRKNYSYIFVTLLWQLPDFRRPLQRWRPDAAYATFSLDNRSDVYFFIGEGGFLAIDVIFDCTAGNVVLSL